MRCTGSSGQMLLHHPDLPLRNVPPMNAPPSAASSSAAVALPLWSNSGRRKATTAVNTAIAIRYPYSLSHFGAASAREKRRLRGAWFIAASGQMFRHSPGATKKSRGKSGMRNRQKTVSPAAGAAINSTATTSAPATLMTRTTCQHHSGMRRRICM
jgi:hypothetical protein